MHDTWSPKGIDLNIWLVKLPKNATFIITPTIGCLCIREFVSNSKNNNKLVDGTSTHPCRPMGLVVTAHSAIKKLLMVGVRQIGEVKMSTKSSNKDHSW